ncbi:glycoside hydrolase family 2 protein [Streptomyces virginiae]|uniref:glycoside hydrolase family 2 protein n=1 Tax=Streptomyces virginiae TaxID=1961 RepID=UPI00225BDD67|nr:sugar-binding domain-containing protein [Streptomyces virginiae]MCX5276763.1 exo-beta-D-glucosaminidase [Streptomyces virginiae]
MSQLPRPAHTRRRRVAAVTLALLGLLIAPAALPSAAAPRLPAGPRSAPTTTTVPPGGTASLAGFAIRSAAEVPDTAAAVSTPGYATAGWHRAGPRSTVLAALVADGTHPDPFYSTDQQRIPRGDFTDPWWYRSDFTLPDTSERTSLDFSGVVSAADVYVNGRRVASAAEVAGMYTRHELDITGLVRAGANTVAFRIQPNDPRKHLTLGWLDWLQPPPDANMGIVRDVLVHRRGSVSLHDAHVVTNLHVPSPVGAVGATARPTTRPATRPATMPSTESPSGAATVSTPTPAPAPAPGAAELTVKARVSNDSPETTTATVTAAIGGTGIVLREDVTLRARETRTLVFAPDRHPRLRLERPALWWPAGMGPQHLYELRLTATVTGHRSDDVRHSFGIRDVRAPLDSAGARRYTINGRPLLIRGAGWSADQLLRWDTTAAEDRIKAALDAGLNTFRLEGHIEPDEFFDLADRHGMLTLPGWECCDKWEGQVNPTGTGEKWNTADRLTARASMAAEAARLRDHPSILSFLIGSDFAPDAQTERDYLDALRAADWPTPVIPAASAVTTALSGPSGMRMTGPYDWVPPSYWYDKREGGATGFNSETSAGPSIPTLDTLRRTLSPAELETLWTSPAAPQYHRSPSRTFNTLKLFNEALTHRFGAPRSLSDYVAKAQLGQYENVRAQFEAYARNATDATAPSTGLIYWMFNSGWTSLHWQLVDRFLDQGGAYYGAKKANEPLHIQYSYDDRTVAVVNRRAAAASGLTARVSLFDTAGTSLYDRTVRGLRVGGDGATTTAVTLPAVVTASGRPDSTYLVRLTLTDGAGREVSRNVYWLSTRPDVLDYDAGDWYHTPTTSYGDLTGLNSLAAATVTATARTTHHAGSVSTTTVTLRNTGRGNTPALLTDLHLVDDRGAPVLPVRWSDNQISLWPGESAVLTAEHRTTGPSGGALRVRISGWNTPTTHITPSTR